MVRRKSFADMQCSVAQALEVVGDPWTLLIVRNALAGDTRFEDFQAGLGIPRTTLTARLAILVDHGLLERRRYQGHPPRYDYRLTARGRDLRSVIITLMQWGDRWALREPPAVIHDAETGRPLELELVDVPTGRTLDEIAVGYRLSENHSMRRGHDDGESPGDQGDQPGGVRPVGHPRRVPDGS